ncbi:MAG: hypothetical protein ACOX7Q_16975 [Kiritimatiellia bacterium]
MPLFWRAFAYFCYRYFLRGGFLEGREGFLWHFLQGWWYRTLVDAKVFEIKRESGGDPQKMLALLRGKVWDEDLSLLRPLGGHKKGLMASNKQARSTER